MFISKLSSQVSGAVSSATTTTVNFLLKEKVSPLSKPEYYKLSFELERLKELFHQENNRGILTTAYKISLFVPLFLFTLLDNTAGNLVRLTVGNIAVLIQRKRIDLANKAPAKYQWSVMKIALAAGIVSTATLFGLAYKYHWSFFKTTKNEKKIIPTPQKRNFFATIGWVLGTTVTAFFLLRKCASYIGQIESIESPDEVIKRLPIDWLNKLNRAKLINDFKNTKLLSEKMFQLEEDLRKKVKLDPKDKEQVLLWQAALNILRDKGVTICF
jgi:hypothetical protein